MPFQCFAEKRRCNEQAAGRRRCEKCEGGAGKRVKRGPVLGWGEMCISVDFLRFLKISVYFCVF